MTLLPMEEEPVTSTGAGLFESDEFVDELSDREVRELFVADQVRVRVATLIRCLREDRGWTQTELAGLMGTTQSVVSRIEGAEYGKVSLKTLLQVASAFDLPLLIDLPEWGEWFDRTRDNSLSAMRRRSFSANALKKAFQRTRSAEPLAGLSEAELGAAERAARNWNVSSVIVEGGSALAKFWGELQDAMIEVGKLRGAKTEDDEF